MKENEKISEFMGAVIVDRNGESAVYMFENAYCPEYFRCTHYDTYHTDWRELMPVVEKIESLTNQAGVRFQVSIDSKYVFNTDTKINDFIYSCAIFKNQGRIVYEMGVTKLSATYQAVIQFINYYNLKEEK